MRRAEYDPGEELDSTRPGNQVNKLGFSPIRSYFVLFFKK
jgi:hypothetical protein